MKRSTVVSTLLHVLFIAVMVVVSRIPSVTPEPPHVTMLVGRDISRYLPTVHPEHGGGGGGGRDVLPAAKGVPPKFARHFPFTPPMQVILKTDPLLPMEPTLLGDPHIVVSNLKLPNYGDPNAPSGPPSNGPGKNGGIGGGDGQGIGNRKGPGYGDDGDNGGVSGLPSGRKGSVSAPILLVKIEPEYSEEARRARIVGTVILRIEVGVDGKAHNMSVRQSLGFGLDERAIEAVGKWKFTPGKQDGKPVTTVALVEVNFRLL